MTPVPKCFGFQWIGQTFMSCDGCERPYWEHSHDESYRNGRIFRRVISRLDREAVQRAWGGGQR